MANMLCAVFYGSNDIRLENRPVPGTGPDDVLVEVKACGICGTDVSMYGGKINYSSGMVGKIFGHEVAGVVKETGSDVNRVNTGDRVVVAPVNYCGTCFFCRRGDENMCVNWRCIGEETDGGYAEYISVPQKQIFSIPDNLSFEEGTLLADPVPTPLHAVRKKADIKPGDTVAVWGSGPQGYCAIQLAKLCGATVIAVARREKKLKLAYELGADFVVDCEKEDVTARIKEVTGRGADICLECGGYPEAVTQAVANVRKGGRVVMIGLQKAQTCDLEDMTWGEKELVASLSSTYQEFGTGIRLARTGSIVLKPLVTHSFPLGSINEAFELLKVRREHVIKVAINP
jgi:2-desacetyl-2-hydroxyethyl bacteriochlorophyllide A dehydrogenase